MSREIFIKIYFFYLIRERILNPNLFSLRVAPSNSFEGAEVLQAEIIFKKILDKLSGFLY